MKKRILVVEDDAALARVLGDNLEFEGFEVRCVGDGNLALSVAREFSPDLAILDVMLPGRDGFELVGLLRQRGSMPIIMLTARGQKADKLEGLKLGADDYVTKPFDIEELMARIHTVLRRSSPEVETVVLGKVTVDFRAMSVRHGRDEIRLTRREFELLRYLAERQGRVVSRGELLRAIWGYPDTPATRSVDHAIARLRRKIETDPGQPRFIRTAHGDGYSLTPDGKPDPLPPAGP